MPSQFLLAITLATFGVGTIAAIAGVMCRAASPSARSLVWNAALLACVAAPISWAVGPTFTLGVPTALVSKVSRSIGVVPAQPTEIVRRAFTQSSAHDLPVSHSIVSTESVGRVALVIWLSGVVFFALRFGRQILFARRLVRRGRKITKGQVLSILADARATLGIRVDVAVLESDEIDIPIAAGIFRPTILLPAYAAEWSASELRTVLLHELAHVKRADIPARAAAMAACGLNWFNPVVWVLSELATRDAELAADDLVLRSGVRPSSYADTLLSVVNSVRRYPDIQPAMPLARTAFLADRVHSILRDSGARSEIGYGTRSGVLIASCAITMLAACVRFSAASPQAFASPVPAPSALPARSSSQVPGAQPQKQKPTITRPPGAPATAAARADTAWVVEATDQLIKALDDMSPQVRGEAAHALGRMNAQRSRKYLSKLLDDPDKFVQYEAQNALSALVGSR